MKKIVISMLLLLPLSCLAGTYLESQKITGLANGWGSKNLYINTDKNLTAENCHLTDKRVVLAIGHDQFDLLASMLLSAIHAQSDVRLYVDGCGPNNFMKLISVKIEH
jgi:hypothetical protein